MTKLVMALALAAGALTFAPGQAAAADCTKQYVKCLNDSYLYEGSLQHMADLECSAEYAGCVVKKWLSL